LSTPPQAWRTVHAARKKQAARLTRQTQKLQAIPVQNAIAATYALHLKKLAVVRRLCGQKDAKKSLEHLWASHLDCHGDFFPSLRLTQCNLAGITQALIWHYQSMSLTFLNRICSWTAMLEPKLPSDNCI
jgi:hypothetical protein